MYTPGPWTHRPYREGHAVRYEVVSATGSLLATTHWVKVAGKIEANARLMAAAPTLLEVCEAMRTYLASTGGFGGPNSRARELMDEAATAIAAAKGEQP